MTTAHCRPAARYMLVVCGRCSGHLAVFFLRQNPLAYPLVSRSPAACAATTRYRARFRCFRMHSQQRALHYFVKHGHVARCLTECHHAETGPSSQKVRCRVGRDSRRSTVAIATPTQTSIGLNSCSTSEAADSTASASAASMVHQGPVRHTMRSGRRRHVRSGFYHAKAT